MEPCNNFGFQALISRDLQIWEYCPVSLKIIFILHLSYPWMSSASLNVLLSNNSFLISFKNMETYLLAFPHQLVSSCFWVEFALSPKNCPQMPKWLDGHHCKHLGLLESLIVQESQLPRGWPEMVAITMVMWLIILSCFQQEHLAKYSVWKKITTYLVNLKNNDEWFSFNFIFLLTTLLVSLLEIKWQKRLWTGTMENKYKEIGVDYLVPYVCCTIQ